MRTKALYVLVILAFGAPALNGPGTNQGAAALPPASEAKSGPSQAPPFSGVLFIENVGQFDPPVRFQVPAGDRILWLTEDGLWVVLPERPEAQKAEAEVPRRRIAIQLSFPGANPHPVLEPFERRITSVNYFLGDDPARWRTNVPAWGGVRYRELYPGVDLEVNGEGRRLRLQLVARAGADLSAVRLRVEGADGVDLLPEGLRLTTAVGAFTLPLLTVEGVRPEGSPAVIPLGAGGFEVIAPFARVALPAAPASISLQSNPSDLLYTTFLGGSGDDYGYGIAVDGSGAVYIVGRTQSTDFPTTTGVYDTTPNGDWDAFLVKLNPAGGGNADLLYATFLGGSGDDWSYDIGVDGNGIAYVAGQTLSSDFPTTSGAYDTTCGTDGNCNYDGTYYYSDAFLVKLNPAGQGPSDLLYATFVGGSGDDEGYGIAYGIAVDGSGAVYVTGYTQSSDFPTTSGAYDTTCGTDGNCNGYWDAFVVKLNPAGQGNADLLYATFLGEDGNDWSYDIGIDGSGIAYVTGYTWSFYFPTTPGAYDTTYNGGGDVFVVKLNPAGLGIADLVYATLLGGRDSDMGLGIAVDGSGAAYVVGRTGSSDFPTTLGAFDLTYNGWGDVFIVKLNPVGHGNADLIYATFLGGSSWDVGYGIAVDGSGTAYVIGGTSSSDFPTTLGAYDPTFNGLEDVFVVKLNPAGRRNADLVYATFLGGDAPDSSRGIAMDGNGTAYITGYTWSSDFPTTSGAYDPTCGTDGNCNGTIDVFMTKLAMGGGQVSWWKVYLPLVLRND